MKKKIFILKYTDLFNNINKTNFFSDNIMMFVISIDKR